MLRFRLPVWSMKMVGEKSCPLIGSKHAHMRHSETMETKVTPREVQAIVAKYLGTDDLLEIVCYLRDNGALKRSQDVYLAELATRARDTWKEGNEATPPTGIQECSDLVLGMLRITSKYA